jgi:PKHD-type hydroxylase
MAHVPWMYPIPLDPDLRVVRGPFTDAQLEQITALGAERLRTAGVDAADEVRRMRWAAIDHEPSTSWIYAALGSAAQTVNSRAWHYDLWGFTHPIQVNAYDAEHAGHAGWHYDYHNHPGSLPFKLSLVLLLSDAQAYEGGDFETWDYQPIGVRTKGTLIVFPSFVHHRVTPVTTGYRLSLAAMLAGPRFR